MNLILTILASAVVSAIVSSLLTLWGQHLERKSRKEEQRLERERQRKELLLTKAIDLALARTNFVKELVIASNGSATFKDSIFLAKTYYEDLQLLLNTGDLSEETKKTDSESLKRYKARS